MRLNKRIEKLEKQSGKKDDRFLPVIVLDFKGEESEAEAIAKWEAENGPLDGRHPLIVRFCAVSPYDVEHSLK